MTDNTGFTTRPRGRPAHDRSGAAALSEAIRRVGGIRPMARALGDISPQAVKNWALCPPYRVLDVEKLSGVSRYKLRPDIFGSKPP